MDINNIVSKINDVLDTENYVNEITANFVCDTNGKIKYGNIKLNIDTKTEVIYK